VRQDLGSEYSQRFLTKFRILRRLRVELGIADRINAINGLMLDFSNPMNEEY
jgi:hypothetical protein